VEDRDGAGVTGVKQDKPLFERRKECGLARWIGLIDEILIPGCPTDWFRRRCVIG
jgi:hypothetical protein